MLTPLLPQRPRAATGLGRHPAVYVRAPALPPDPQRDPGRSSRPDVRNPLLALATVQRLQLASAVERATLALPLRQLQQEWAAAAQRDWQCRNLARAAVFKAAGVYAGHLCRALAAPGLPPLLAERARRRRLDANSVRGLLAPLDRGERRNVLLRLPAMHTLLALPAPARAQLAEVLAELAAESRQRSDEAWRSNKAPISFYQFAVSSYARHLRRRLACDPPVATHQSL